MKTFAAVLFFLIVSASTFAEETDTFYEGENVVGLIKDSNGNKYIVIETPDGKAKLIKTEKNPEEILKGSSGITKEDFEIR